ncbi:MAG: family 16 glycoside hydrolase [Candidatus Korobacteraceae bacterium]
MSDKRFLLLMAFLLLGTVPALAGGPSFNPDVTFKGSSLTGWQTLGQANWRAENGELIGTPQAGSGGWIMLDRSYQDVGFYADFRCTGGCETGALFRVKKSDDGWKGVFVSLTEEGTPSYGVTLDAQGKILTRNKLPRGGGLVRVSTPPDPNAPQRQFTPPRYNVKLPFTPPDTSLRANEWNQIEFMLDANVIRAVLNNGREAGGITDEGYGPLALYVGGSGEARFKNVAYADLGLKERVPDKTSSDFRKQRVNDFYYSMSAAAADFNRDGVLDIVSGPYIYYGPDYTKSREITLAESTSPSTSFNDWWVQYASDFTGDGWPDVIKVNYGGQAGGVYLYVNPKGEGRRWDMHKVVTAVQSEIALLADIDGSGKPAVVYMGDGYVAYAKPDAANPTGPWVVRRVSEQGYGTAHGIGAGDVNGDGRVDILNMYGWWEQPSSGGDQPWKYHPEVFGRYGHGGSGGSVMAVYDANGDGLNDVVTALNAHGWGMAWFEQKRDAQGNISFVQHMIMDDLGTAKENAGGVVFSEPHGTTYMDMDGDGIPDYIAGKRYWSHNADYLDVDPFGPPVLYWYKTVRDPKAPGKARFVPELIDNSSGAGSTLLTTDLNKDGAVDVVTGSKLGTFIFWGKPRSGRNTSASR